MLLVNADSVSLDRGQEHTQGEGGSVRHRQAHQVRHHQHRFGERHLNRKLVFP